VDRHEYGSLRVSFVEPLAVISELVCNLLSFELGPSPAFSGKAKKVADEFADYCEWFYETNPEAEDRTVHEFAKEVMK
jgi:hypothetical protein